MDEKLKNLELEQIKAPLRPLILDAIRDKSSLPAFFVREKLLQLQPTPSSIAGLLAYEKQVIQWAKDPSARGTERGFGFEIFMKYVFEKVYELNPGLLVMLTPAPLDHILPDERDQVGNSGDILICNREGDLISPISQVSIKMSDSNNSNRPGVNNLLDIKVLQLLGNMVFPDVEQQLLEFAISTNPIDYAHAQGAISKKQILEYLLYPESLSRFKVTKNR